jgi:hypothetical protein
VSAGTGIAGAQDYQPADRPTLSCCVCGAEVHGGMRTSPSARAMPGRGVIHACSPECAAKKPFVWEWVWR